MSIFKPDTNKPLVEEYFVCTVRPDSCHAVTRYNEDGETKKMIHFASAEEAREFARDMAIKFCTEEYQQRDPVRCFLAKHTRTGGGLPYLNEDIGRFGKDGVEIFLKKDVEAAPEFDAETVPEWSLAHDHNMRANIEHRMRQQDLMEDIRKGRLGRS